MVIEEATDAASCQMPPAFDGDASPAVSEARGIRKAYDRIVERRGVSSVGRAIDADTVPAAIEALERVAAGTPLKEADLPGKNTVAVCHDVRTYYEEAAVELANGPLGSGRAIENWFFEETEAGKVVLAARKALADEGVPFPFWFYMAPGHR